MCVDFLQNMIASVFLVRAQVGFLKLTQIAKQLNHTTTHKAFSKTLITIECVGCSADFCNLSNLMDSLSHWVESESAILTLGLAGSKYISSTESAMARTLRP